MPAWLERWLSRHQHPVSCALHAVGIPIVVLAAGAAIAQIINARWDLWYGPVALFVLGYLLQWVGHRVEGNDMGEVILLKRWLGRSYVAVAPRYRSADAEEPDGPV